MNPPALEYKTSKLLSEEIEKYSFRVERGVAGMPTAFVATYGSSNPVARENLLLFVQRASGEGEYSLTVRAYKACLKDLFSAILLDKTTMGILLVVVGTLWFLVLLLTKGSKLLHDHRRE